MYIELDKTLERMAHCIPAGGKAGTAALRSLYEQSFRLQSQVLALIYDAEMFSAPTAQQERLAKRNSAGSNTDGVVTLTLSEPLPPLKRLTEAVEEHWKTMIHAAISEAAQQEPLPWFEKAMVEIRITTPRGTDNSRVWDTSNRAIQVILNNLKGIFFRDDDMEHMAFSVVGEWGEKGATILRVSDYGKSRQI